MITKSTNLDKLVAFCLQRSLARAAPWQPSNRWTTTTQNQSKTLSATSMCATLFDDFAFLKAPLLLWSLFYVICVEYEISMTYACTYMYLPCTCMTCYLVVQPASTCGFNNIYALFSYDRVQAMYFKMHDCFLAP